MANMRDQTWLLEMLIHYWDQEQKKFNIGQIPLQIKVEDIYFITGISQMVEAVHKNGKVHASINVSNYIVVYYAPDTDKVGWQVLTKHITSL